MLCVYYPGTGACAVYPLLGSRRGWNMIGTESDPDSVSAARQNVERNGLQKQVQSESVAAAAGSWCRADGSRSGYRVAVTSFAVRKITL